MAGKSLTISQFKEILSQRGLRIVIVLAFLILTKFHCAPKNLFLADFLSGIGNPSIQHEEVTDLCTM